MYWNSIENPRENCEPVDNCTYTQRTHALFGFQLELLIWILNIQMFFFLVLSLRPIEFETAKCLSELINFYILCMQIVHWNEERIRSAPSVDPLPVFRNRKKSNGEKNCLRKLLPNEELAVDIFNLHIEYEHSNDNWALSTFVIF